MPVTAAAGYPQQSGSFIPEIWSTTLNVKFYESVVIPEITNNNWEGEITDVGDKVIIRQTPDMSIVDYQKGQSITYEDLEEDTLSLEIDKAKLFAAKVDDIDKYQSDVDLLDDWGEDGTLQMQITVDTEFLGAVYSDAASANSGNSAGALSGDIDMGSSSTPKVLTKNNVVDFLVDVNTVLDENNIPEQYRYIVLPAWACGLIKKSELKDASVTADGSSILRTGYLGMVDRVSIYSSNLLNKSSGKYDVIFGHISAITFASQFIKVEYIDQLQETFGSAIRGLNVYGYEVVKSQALGHAVIQKG